MRADLATTATHSVHFKLDLTNQTVSTNKLTFSGATLLMLVEFRKARFIAKLVAPNLYARGHRRMNNSADQRSLKVNCSKKNTGNEIEIISFSEWSNYLRESHYGNRAEG